MTMLSRERPEGRNAAIVGLLDIGTSKIACLIAALEPAEGHGSGPRAKVLGVGHMRSKGLKGGVELIVQAAISLNPAGLRQVLA